MRISKVIAKSNVALGSSHAQAEPNNQPHNYPASELARMLRRIMHTLATGVPRKLQPLGSIVVDPN